MGEGRERDGGRGEEGGMEGEEWIEGMEGEKGVESRENQETKTDVICTVLQLMGLPHKLKTHMQASLPWW